MPWQAGVCLLSPPLLEDETYNLSSLFHMFAFNVLEKAVVSLFSFVFFRLNISYLLYHVTLFPGILTSWPPSSGHACWLMSLWCVAFCIPDAELEAVWISLGSSLSTFKSTGFAVRLIWVQTLALSHLLAVWLWPIAIFRDGCHNKSHPTCSCNVIALFSSNGEVCISFFWKRAELCECHDQ